jgi:hypothetical protein
LLTETGSGSENAGSETESGYAGARKRTNTIGNSTEMGGSRKLKPEYRTSLYSQSQSHTSLAMKMRMESNMKIICTILANEKLVASIYV